MRCPKCKYHDSKVVDSRSTDDGSSIRRRRECPECGNRFTTYEKLGEKPLVVIKRNGAVEAFDSEKLYRGILISCAKRPVDSDTIDKLINSIEKDLARDGIFEIKSSDLGEMVLEKLAEIDSVAYVRFASVYRDFSNVGEFKSELKNL
ncbi:MAG: transcriptional regulator NrdR [Coriobacteriia bacterium]|nr:transcriptional regulator NrdR [Coriobacteriia bacterium]